MKTKKEIFAEVQDKLMGEGTLNTQSNEELKRRVSREIEEKEPVVIVAKVLLNAQESAQEAKALLKVTTGQVVSEEVYKRGLFLSICQQLYVLTETERLYAEQFKPAPVKHVDPKTGMELNYCPTCGRE